MENHALQIDCWLGRPIAASVRLVRIVFGPLLIAWLATRYQSGQLRTAADVSLLVVILVGITRGTPYLLLSCVCFAVMAWLPVPRSIAVEDWWKHAALLAAATLFLGRTWRLWPATPPRQQTLPEGARTAPWWVFALGLLVSAGLFGLIAYELHCRD